MNTNDSIQKSSLTKAVLALYDEAYLGSPDPKAGTWFTDNDPKNGFLGTIESLSSAEASRSTTPGDPLTIASHVAHLEFSLDLANRAARGENPYPGAEWARSWDQRVVSDAEWQRLVASLRSEYEAFRAYLASGANWDEQDFMTGTLGLIAHGAWHLGAIRQALGLVRAPK
jgi:hypothetical protein